MDGHGLSILVLKSRLSEQQHHFNTKSYTLFFLPRRRDHGDNSEYIGMVTLRTVLNSEAEIISKDPAVFRVPVDAVTAMQRVSTLGFRPVTACVEPATVEGGSGLHVWTMASPCLGVGSTGQDNSLESSAVLHAMAAQHQRLSAQAKSKESAALLVNSNVTSAELPNEDGNLPVHDEAIAGVDRNGPFVTNVAAEAALRSQHRRVFPNVDGRTQGDGVSPNDSATSLIMEGVREGGNKIKNLYECYEDDDDQHQIAVDEEEYENEGIEGDDEQFLPGRNTTISFNDGNHNRNNNFSSKSATSLTQAAFHKSAQLSMSYRYSHLNANTTPKMNGIGRGGSSSGKRRGRPPLPRDAYGQIVRPPPGSSQRTRGSYNKYKPMHNNNITQNAGTVQDFADIREIRHHAPTGSATQITDATGIVPQTFVKRSRGRPRKDGSISPHKLMTGNRSAVVAGSGNGATTAEQPFSIPTSSSDIVALTNPVDLSAGVTTANSAASSTAAVSTDDLVS